MKQKLLAGELPSLPNRDRISQTFRHNPTPNRDLWSRISRPCDQTWQIDLARY